LDELIFGLTGFYKIHGGGDRRFHLVEMIESGSDEAKKEVISHTEGLEALERAVLYVE
jgi:hypothetical protein